MARISIDQAVRALEKQQFVRHLAVTIKMVDLKSLPNFDLNSSIAPGRNPSNFQRPPYVLLSQKVAF